MTFIAFDFVSEYYDIIFKSKTFDISLRRLGY